MEASLTQQGDTSKAWGAGLLGWAFPGLGHVFAGRLWRGVFLGGVVCLLFLAGILLGGHFYGLLDDSSGFLSYVFGLFDLGMGGLYVLLKLLGVATKEQASVVTAEYGNVFLMCAGLLNYLLALDAYDIAAGRKH
jgi:hypothetical protein